MDTLTLEGNVPNIFRDQSEVYLKICDENRAKTAIFFGGIDTGFGAGFSAIGG